MATKRERANGTWEFVVKNKKLLGRPLSLTFDTEAEGDKYCRTLEELLRNGVVPEDLKQVNRRPHVDTTLNHVIRDYLSNDQVSDSDVESLGVTRERHGDVRLNAIDYEWVKKWVTGMKRELVLSPTTIKHHVGALARCFDWAGTDGKYVQLATNPVKTLRRGYSEYTDADKKFLGALGEEARVEIVRDRRVEPKEEVAVRGILDGQKPKGKQRAFELNFQAALELLFELAVQTAMRMSEMYTLTREQVDVARRTIFLDHTKNGDKRQVPLSSDAVRAIREYQKHVRNGTRGMAGFAFEGGRFFPWWDGSVDKKGKPTTASKRKTTNLLTRQFKRIFAAAGCADLNFHDCRHEATSRLYERTKLSDVQIAKITGHKDLRMLLRYANLRPSPLVKELW